MNAMAVYTKVSEAELTAFLENYDLGALVSFQGIREGIENSNYFVTTTAGRFILTLFEKRVKPDELPYFLNLMTHLNRKGIACPLTVVGKDGLNLRDLCGRKACLTTFLNGKSARDITPARCAELGAAMARMHLAGSDYPTDRANDLSVDGWAALLDKIGAAADTVEAGLAKEMAADYADIKRDFPSGLPRGVIHADLFPDNVFFENGKLSGVIDFYFACNDALAYEVAICLNAWCFDAGSWRFNPDKARAMTAAYQSVRPLNAAEKAALPVLARGAALRFLLTRTFDWLNRVPDALVTPKDPAEYIAKLRFHRSVSDASVYGV